MTVREGRFAIASVYHVDSFIIRHSRPKKIAAPRCYLRIFWRVRHHPELHTISALQAVWFILRQLFFRSRNTVSSLLQLTKIYGNVAQLAKPQAVRICPRTL